MSVSELDKIDFTLKSDDGSITLVISDHLDWSEVDEHLHQLQEKINVYIGFIEGGELHRQFPEAKGKVVKIAVYGLHDLVPEAYQFYEHVASILQGIGADISFKQQHFNSP